jgi:hypothetical protein
MKKVDLFADAACWDFKWSHPDEFNSYGCGPGGVGDFLVPDTVYGLSIREACKIHDWGYRHCEMASEDDRARHDRILHNNSQRIIKVGTDWGWVLTLRLRRALTYYQMVRNFGANAYWEERNQVDNLRAVPVVEVKAMQVVKKTIAENLKRKIDI